MQLDRAGDGSVTFPQLFRQLVLGQQPALSAGHFDTGSHAVLMVNTHSTRAWTQNHHQKAVYLPLTEKYDHRKWNKTK